MDITYVFEAILTIIMFVMMRFVVPCLKSHISDAKWAELYKWVSIAVRAAEMIYKDSGMGADKYNFVREFLADRGYTVNDDEIDAMIESAVLELKREAAPQ